MLSIFLEHQSPAKARRALLISAAITVFMQSLDTLTGHISFFGLEVGMSQEKLVLFSRLITAYFLYVFFWFFVEFYVTHGTSVFVNYLRRREEQLSKNARELETYDPNEQHQERDGWWLDAKTACDKRERATARREALIRHLGLLKELLVVFVPPLVFGALAVCWPEKITNLIGRLL